MEAGGQPPRTPAPAQTPTPATPPADVGERIEGLRAWVAQLDRKLGVRSYAGGAALVLALAAAIVAIVLVLGVKEDSATTAELERLRGEVAGVERSATQAAQDDLAGLTSRVEALESQVASLRSDQDATDKEISVVQDDIVDLRDDIAAIDGGGGAAPGN